MRALKDIGSVLIQIMWTLHTANLIAQRNYLVEKHFDRKPTDAECARIDELDVLIDGRLGL